MASQAIFLHRMVVEPLIFGWRMTAESVLDLAEQALEQWEKGVSVDDFLDSRCEGAAVERRILSSVLFAYFRNRALIGHALGSLVPRKPAPVVRRALEVTLAQAWFQDGLAPEVAVSVAVDFVRARRGAGAAGFVNAVARNALRLDRAALFAAAPEHVRLNLPLVLHGRWRRRFGAALEGMSDLLSRKAPFVFRLQDLALARELDADARFRRLHLDFLPAGLRFYSCDVPELVLSRGWFESGKIYGQDPATAVAPSMFTGIPGGGMIADLCAAPGGKALLLAALNPEATVVAADKVPRRARRMSGNFAAAKLGNAVVLVADALAPPFRDGAFDAVLLDVPCSNTGVGRRRPDALWRFSEPRMEELVTLQRNMLWRASKLVAPGGELVYSTCSLEDEEGTGQIKAFVGGKSGFELVRETTLLPGEDNDGVYAALLRRA